MKQEFQTALAKGLPFPILTITEYLSQDGEGFCWGRSYRLAGYYANILLW
jgi:dual oxidase maturation factor 1